MDDLVVFMKSNDIDLNQNRFLVIGYRGILEQNELKYQVIIVD